MDMWFNKILLLIVLTAFSLPAALAGSKPNLNPEYGSSVYNAFTVFSPDAASPEDYRQDVVVVLHGFMSALPNGTFKRVRKKLLKTHTVLGLNYDPLEVEATVAFLDRVAKEHLSGKRVTVLGTSLGGFWARYFGARIGARSVVLLNPVIRPARHMLKHEGSTRTNRRRIQDYTIGVGAFDAYQRFDVDRMAGPPTLLIVARDDDRIDPEVALSALKPLPGVVVQVYAEGGHTINLKKHPALGRIATFVLTGQ